jgi:hypothetical protein
MADVYSERPNLYIGFYGCDKVRGMDLLEKPNKVLVSTHDYEWLGHGFYIWENNMDRALDWAREHHPRFNDPFVIGVVYTLGNCLDLTDKHFIELLKEDYALFSRDLDLADQPLPQNTDLKHNPNPSGILRKLDCALIQHLHAVNENPDKLYDSVRGAFTEGEPAYPGTQICEKNHIQVCIRNVNCIKGFFLPRG